MPRERGLNYTPDADGYSFDDTAIGEAAQASFHRLASGYPQQEPDQQEPDDMHHLAKALRSPAYAIPQSLTWNCARLPRSLLHDPGPRHRPATPATGSAVN